MSELIPIRTVRGDQGTRGPAGGRGVRGSPGAQGIPGPTGATGSTGAQGVTGSTGSTGSTGGPGSLSKLVDIDADTCVDVEASPDDDRVTITALNGLYASGPGGGVIPVEGAGTRMLWHQGKGAFRSGTVTGTQWDEANVGGNSHAEGSDTIASGLNSHAEGTSTTSTGISSHTEGSSTSTTSFYAHAEGLKSTASGEASHAEGDDTLASGDTSHAEGSGTVADGEHSHAEGKGTKALLEASHAEGDNTTASGDNSHAEGDGTTASSKSAHSEGDNTKASGEASHAEGLDTTASGDSSHAEGLESFASGEASHAEGESTEASGNRSHAEGDGTKASGGNSHSEGDGTTASGSNSHSEGDSTIALGSNSHTEGSDTIASKTNDHIMGSGGNSSARATDLFGWYMANGSTPGPSTMAAAIAVTVSGGEATGYASAWVAGGADYAEYYEWVDGNSSNEDRIALVVSHDETQTDKIRISSFSDTKYDVLGITSVAAGVIGNAKELNWQGKVETDHYGRVVNESNYTLAVKSYLKSKGFALDKTILNTVVTDHTSVNTLTEAVTNMGTITVRPSGYTDEQWESLKTPILSLDPIQSVKLVSTFDPTTSYIPRSQRQEWQTIGLMGKLRVRDNDTVVPGKLCMLSQTVPGTVVNYDPSANPSVVWRTLKRIAAGVVEVKMPPFEV